MKSHPNDPILRPKQAVEMVGLSIATIYRKIDKGEFPQPIKLSARAIGWRRSVIDAWLHEQEAKMAS